MRKKAIIVALAALSSSCGRSSSDNAAQAQPNAENQLSSTTAPPPDAINAREKGDRPDDRTPVSEGLIDPKSAQGAKQVMQRFGELIEQRRLAEAYRLWSDDGRASGVSESQFIAAYEKYDEIHAEVGAPGPMEGAAGSIYADMPLRLYGKRKGGQPFNSIGTATLRRVNDVPGSTEEQRRWRILRIDLQPPA